MAKFMIEFPVVGYAEVEIEVDDDLTPDEVLEGIRDGDIEVSYDGNSYAESLTPLLDIIDARNLDIPQSVGVVL